MSAHWDKIVKLACKPKLAAPKAKYLDPIMAATYSEDGSLRDVCAALAVRLRDPSVVVMHKALLVLHTMIRTGHTDNVLSFLGSSGNDVLKLRYFASGSNDGRALSENLSSYAAYLDTRIRVYRDLKHDIIRIQNENNREDRMYGGESSRATNGSSSNSRTKKLRQLTVEKGLLRETKGVQKQIDTVLQCKFFLDNLEDELTLATLRLLVKDLLILFQAVNEGVVNVLEHYFEMSAIDAETSLSIYKSFCVQTEGVVEYLSIARKLSNLLNVPVPNLRHAPTKLAGALEEYLKDPNFEQNRIEYKTNKALADGKIPNKTKPQPATSTSKEETTPKLSSGSESGTSSVKTGPKQPAIDLLASIEESQPTIFGTETNATMPSWFQQQPSPSGFNPFRQSTVVPQTTGIATQPFATAQSTGFAVPSASPFAQPNIQMHVTGIPFQMTPSPSFQALASQPTGAAVMPFQSGTAVVQPQPTGFLQPQMTGSNPFRQSMAFSQMTGIPGPNSSSPPPTSQPRSASALTFSLPQSPQSQTSEQPKSHSPFTAALINRPASTPITSGNNGQTLKPVVSHVTGSRNPFGQPKAPSPPPVPKPATLGELSMSAFGGSGIQTNLTGMPSNTSLNPQSGMPSAATQQQFSSRLASALGGSETTSPANPSMSSIASAFVKPAEGFKPSSPSTETPVKPQFTSTTTTSDLSNAFSSLSFSISTGTNTTSTTAPTSPPSISVPLQPQITGFAGLKQFKPTSSFGASLLDSLPPPSSSSNASSTANTPISTTNQASNPLQLGVPNLNLPGTSNTSNPSSTTNGALNTQTTGLSSFNSRLGSGSGLGTSLLSGASTPGPSGANSVGVGLRPQMTGGGAANPFRASATIGPGTTSPSLGGLTTTPTGSAGPSPNSSFGSSPFNSGASAFKPSLATIPSFTGAFPGATQQTQQAQQQHQGGSLI